MKRSTQLNALKPKQEAEILSKPKARFEENPGRHADIRWEDIQKRLSAQPAKLWTLYEMERTGGEPDVIGQDPESGAFLLVDCSPESPEGRAGLCYDQDGLASRKEHRPKGSVVEAAAMMGVELLDEVQYHALQRVGEFDLKSSSWLRTPPEIRALGGALFGDRRYGRVFIFHNGAQSYYSGRGFRGLLRI